MMSTNTQSSQKRMNGEADTEKRFHAHVQSLLERMADEHRGLWLAQELRDRTIARVNWDGDLIHAHYLRLKPIVGEILGGDADEEMARLSSFSILGQCAFYLCSHALVARFYPERYLKPETIERVARHIAQFSFGALKELKK